MNTPAHLIVGLAAFGRADRHLVTTSAFGGALLPDLSLYLMTGWHVLVLGTSAEVVFRDLYYSDSWQQVFAIDNSFVFWGIACAMALWARSAWAVALTGAALLHLAMDFPLHNHDARMHFWPLTDWKFISPVSYWENARGGSVVGLIETALVLVLAVVLVWRYRASAWRWIVAGIATLQLAPFVIWRLVF